MFRKYVLPPLSGSKNNTKKKKNTKQSLLLPDLRTSDCRRKYSSQYLRENLKSKNVNEVSNISVFGGAPGCTAIQKYSDSGFNTFSLARLRKHTAVQTGDTSD
jgi:hypothetical protein